MKEFITRITKEAGLRALSYYNDPEISSIRGTSKEVTTKYDKLLDNFLISEIEKEYPEHNLLTEESGEKNKGSNYTWVVDSLDGSGNFANKNPLFSICIALLKDKEIIMGTIFHPALDNFYFAEKDNGAYYNEEKINVSDIENLNSSYIVYCEGNQKDKEVIKNIFDNIYPHSKDTRKIGSAGVECAWVARGLSDGYYTTLIDPWDIMPGYLLVKEAGGKITDFEGNNWNMKQSNIVMSNGKIHNELLKRINE